MPKDPVETIDRKVGAAIKRERERRGMTLASVADEANFSQQMLCHLEAGRARVYLGRLVMIARALRRPLTFFLRSIGERK